MKAFRATMKKLTMLALMAGMIVACGKDNKINQSGSTELDGFGGSFVISDVKVQAFQQLAEGSTCNWQGDGTQKAKKFFSVRVAKVGGFPGSYQFSQQTEELGITHASQISTADSQGVYFGAAAFGSAMMIVDYADHIKVYILGCVPQEYTNEAAVNSMYNINLLSNVSPYCQHYVATANVQYQFTGSVGTGNFIEPYNLEGYYYSFNFGSNRDMISGAIIYDMDGAFQNINNGLNFCGVQQ
jgi:hypothetical protein